MAEKFDEFGRRNVTQTVDALRSTQLLNYFKDCKFGMINCSTSIKTVLTDEGYCFTFNLYDQEYIFKDDIQTDYPYATMAYFGKPEETYYL